jgi:hypothetical protein
MKQLESRIFKDGEILSWRAMMVPDPLIPGIGRSAPRLGD